MVMKVQYINQFGIFQKSYNYNNLHFNNINFTGGNGEISDSFESAPINISPEKTADKKDKISLQNAQDISGIHCPACGNKMLSKNTYNQLVEESLKIKTSKQLINLLSKNEEFIPNNYKQILYDTKKIPDRYDLSVREYVTAMSDLAHQRKIKDINNIKIYLTEFTKTLPEDEAFVLREFVSGIDENMPYADFKEKLTHTLDILGLLTGEINAIKKNTLKTYVTSEMYDNLFNIENIENLNDGEISQLLMSNLFNPSRNHIRNIQKYENFRDNPCNNLLICGECAKRRAKFTFFKYPVDPDLKNNVALYLKDISFLNGAGIIDIPQTYIAYVCATLKALTKGEINFDPQEVKILGAAQSVMSRHNGFAPIMQTEVDIPCAECATTMMPHTIKLKIISQLNECKSPYDYAQLLQKYDKYINIYTKDLVKIITKIIDKNPYISEEECVRQFENHARNHLRLGVAHAIADYKKSRQYYSNINSENLKAYYNVEKRVKKYFESGKFDDFNYNNLYQACFSQINQDRINLKSISILKRNLKKIAYKSTLAFPAHKINNNDSGKLYNIVYSIFNSDTATVDHLIAMKNNGKSDKKNMIGLCKACNYLKGSQSVIAWYDQHPYVRENFPKQIAVINEMAQNGEIKGYENWAHEIAEQMYALTKGEFDITDDYPAVRS